VQRATCFTLLGVFIGVLAACEQAPTSPLAPSAAAFGGGPAPVEADAAAPWGAVASGLRRLASVDSELPCALGPFGLADNSQFVSTPSGNESLVCTGSTASTGEQGATILTGFPCGLPSGTITTDSRLVLTPSGHVTLSCKAK
jgi:hypothetical protein